ncbi:MAG: amidohydrolase family protein [Candidatus Binatia bacterium]|nr:amidohydrolase family protein [Candidatus Binatia bacterium]
MSYAGDRFCWDADSHLMPDADFLAKHADPAFRDEMWILGGKNGGEKFEKQFGRMLENVRARLADPEKTAELETRVISTAKGWDAHGAVDPGERSRTLDLLGFQGQLIFSTFAGRYRFAREPELMYAGARAHTRAMAAFCEADERMMAVTMIPLDDPQRALVELKEALSLGVGAVQVPSDAPGGVNEGFSPAHVDLEPFWACLAEARVPLVLHVGGGHLAPRAYHENGRPRPSDWLGGGENLRGKDYPSLHHSPANFLTALVLDGVFERHPELRCGVIELGASWVPSLLVNLDHAQKSFSRSEPLLKDLPMKPSDYLRRQVRFTPFPFEDVGWLVQHCGEELFLFSSDYPHPEGGRDPIKKFETSFEEAGTQATARERFYRTNFEELMRIGGA